MKADGSLKSLLQGVSQQPVRDRLPGQCTQMINMSADPVKGLSRRPGDDLVGFLGAAPAQAWGNFQIQDGRKFVAKIVTGGFAVFDNNGNSYPVAVDGDAGYFTFPGKWSFCTIKEKTYFANSGVITRMRSEVASYPNQTQRAGILQVLGGAYGKIYQIIIDGEIVVQYQTPTGSDPEDANAVGTVTIAEVLTFLLQNVVPVTGTLAPFRGQTFFGTGKCAAGTGWGATRVTDMILITAPNGNVFTMVASDDSANINFKAMVDSVPDIADLPRSAPHNYVVRVAKETDPNEDLWLHFVSDAVGATDFSNFGTSGAWYETLAPGFTKGFDPTTMPRVITFDGTTFHLNVETWADRTVGTETTNPTPSFIGYGINDVAIFQSRLVFVAGQSAVASRSKKYQNFWVGSASTLVDSDPIDVTSQAAFASTLEYAIPHNKDLVIFSTQGQFIMFGRTTLTPSNAAIVLTTSFEADLEARPSACGRNVFFATKFGRFTGIREFFTEGGTDINDTRPITSHVKEYLVGNIRHLSSTSNYDTLLVHTTEETNVVYLYQFIWQDQSKVQSAWSRWEFDSAVVHSFFDQQDIYLVIQRTDGYYLHRLSLDAVDEDDLTYHVHLAAKFDVDDVNTQFILPFGWLANANMIAVQGAGCPNPGLPVRITNIVNVPGEGQVVTLHDDMEGGHIVVGVRFNSEYWPTMPRVTDGSGDVISNARLQINQFITSLETTGHIIGQKMTKWGNGPEVEFEGWIVNAANSVIGSPALDDFSFQLPYKERADRGEIRFFTDKHWPMTMLDIEWEGTVNKRGKRITTGARQQ